MQLCLCCKSEPDAAACVAEHKCGRAFRGTVIRVAAALGRWARSVAALYNWLYNRLYNCCHRPSGRLLEPGGAGSVAVASFAVCSTARPLLQSRALRPETFSKAARSAGAAVGPTLAGRGPPLGLARVQTRSIPHFKLNYFYFSGHYIPGSSIHELSRGSYKAEKAREGG